MQVFGEPCFESYYHKYCNHQDSHTLRNLITSHASSFQDASTGLPWWQCAFGRRPTTGLSQHSPQQFWSQGTIPCTHSASTEANANHTHRLIRKPTTSLPSVVPWGQDLRPRHPYVPHSLIVSTQETLCLLIRKKSLKHNACHTVKAQWVQWIQFDLESLPWEFS